MTSSEVEPVRSSVIQIKIGNRTYDAVQNRNCATCMHPARFQIESKLLLNYSYAAVSRFVSELNQQKRDGSVEEWPELTPAQIKRHFEYGHCPVEGEIARALVEERARDKGIDLTNANGQYLDHIIVQKAILARGYELLVRGNIEPDVKDTLVAAKLLGEAEVAESTGASEAQWQEFMSIYFNAVQSVVSNEQWEEIKSHITSHPAFQSMKNTNNEEEVIDAEVIE
jgi:hypothetical protein